jgi:hypothetical protein
VLNECLACILITVDATDDLIRQAFRARVSSVIPKPISKNVVLYTVVRTLVRVYGIETTEDDLESDAGNPR